MPDGYLTPNGEVPGDTADSAGGSDTDDTDPGSQDAALSDLDWRLHGEVESLVYVSWEQSEAATVHAEYSFDSGDWQSSPSWAGEAGAQEHLLAGIPYDSTASWRLVVEGGSTYEGETITTGDAPSGLPEAVLLVSEPISWFEQGKYLLASINQDTGGWTGGTYWTFIVDRQGRPVWANSAPNRHWTLFAQVAVSGDHILWDEATYWSDYDEGAGSSVHKTYLDDEIDEVATPGLHHAFVQLPDDSLVWGSQHHGGGEALVEKGPDEDDETILWTCDGDWPNSSYCESNGLYYAVESDSFLYSFYTNDSIVEVDHSTGESLWWAGGVRGGYEFDPADSEFAWQHGVSYTAEGTLLVSTENYDGPPSTWVREYNVNHDGETLEQVWSHDSGIYASTNGDAWRLDNGNTLHVLGSAGEIIEVDPDGEEVWHLDFNGSHLLGRGEFIENLYALVSPAG